MAQRAFAVFLQELRDGRTHTELTASLESLLAAVKNTGKGGSIMLEIKVKPAGRGADVDKVVIMDSVTAKLPKPERSEDFSGSPTKTICPATTRSKAPSTCAKPPRLRHSPLRKHRNEARAHPRRFVDR